MLTPLRNGACRKSAIGVRRRTPSDCIEKCFQPFGVVQAGDGRKPGFLDDVRAGLDFPDDFDLLAEAVFVDRRRGSRNVAERKCPYRPGEVSMSATTHCLTAHLHRVDPAPGARA